MGNAKFDVVCLGILVADIVVSGAKELPPPGAISPVAGLSLNLGGCAANTAVGLARLGFKVAVVGKVGDDQLGHFVLDALKREKVDVEGVRISGDAPTGSAVACVYPDGERGFWSLLGCNGEMRLEDVDMELIRSARILHVAGSPFLRGFNGEGCAKMMRELRAEGVVTSLDTINYGAGFRELLEPEMMAADLLLPSYDEAKSLSGETVPEAIAKKLLKYGAEVVVVKLGGDGAFVADGRSAARVPGLKVDVVDTVGAGDAFVAGFLAGWLEGRTPLECARWGNVVGAKCVSAAGATAGACEMEELRLTADNLSRRAAQ